MIRCLNCSFDFKADFMNIDVRALLEKRQSTYLIIMNYSNHLDI